MRLRRRLRQLLGQPEVIVTLTSYPPRISTVSQAIETVLKQSWKPDRILLWLVNSDFPEGKHSLPPDLLALEQRGLDIRFTSIDLKVHNKYFWTLEEFADAIIITVDDDVLYRRDVIASLMTAYRRFPQAVSARRAHRMLFNQSGELLPYVNWQFEFMDELLVARNDLFATGVTGVLYPPNTLVHELMTVENIQNTCIEADDVWLKFIELVKGIPVLVCSDYLPTHQMIDNSQEVARWPENNQGGGNDRQIANVLALLNEYHGSDDTLLERIRKPL